MTSPLRLRCDHRLVLAIVCLTLANTVNFAQENKAPYKLDELVFTQEGELPIIISAPHGGTREIDGVPERKGEGMKKGGAGFFAGRDTATEELAYAVIEKVTKLFGKKPYAVVSRTHRKYLDPNRPPDIAYEDEDAKPVYDRYHQTLERYKKDISSRFRSGVLVDIHGQGESRETVFRGTRNGSTVKHLRQAFGETAFTGENSFFAMLEREGYVVHPKPFDGKEASGFTGGHIVGTYGSSAGGTIDAYQLEFGAEYRVKSRLDATASQLAEALVDYADLYLDRTPSEAPKVQR